MKAGDATKWIASKGVKHPQAQAKPAWLKISQNVTHTKHWFWQINKFEKHKYIVHKFTFTWFWIKQQHWQKETRWIINTEINQNRWYFYQCLVQYNSLAPIDILCSQFSSLSLIDVLTGRMLFVSLLKPIVHHNWMLSSFTCSLYHYSSVMQSKKLQYVSISNRYFH